MEELSALFHGFSVVLTPFNITLMFVGIVLGVVIGVLPGLGGANGIAILIGALVGLYLRRDED